MTTIPVLPANYSGLPSSWLSNWNWEDQSGPPYTTTVTNPNPKPGLQQFFQTQRNNADGGIASPSVNQSGWETFLNYYLWMESCVDTQIGSVLNALKASNFWKSTVIIFTADHGDYGGSHGLHDKGGGLYEEALNVPLFVSFPSARANWPKPPAQGPPPALPYVCSAVDLLPFIYRLALGNDTWRTNSGDIVNYLSGREAILDAILQSPNTNIRQRRISSIKLHQPFPANGCDPSTTPCPDWQSYQPFVLHTADDYSTATDNYGVLHPSHAIAFRTVDQTDPVPTAQQLNGQTKYGGGKLGVYSYWDTCHPTDTPIIGLGAPGTSGQPLPEYEFYNYSPNPPGNDSTHPAVNAQETGNTYFVSNASGNEGNLYITNFFSSGPAHGISIQNELYINPSQLGPAIQTAFNNYINYLQCTGLLTGSNGQIDMPQGACPTDTSCPNCESSNMCPPVYNP